MIISTADFQHATHTIEAVAAGADAYVEKPFAETMADARATLAAVRASDRDRADRLAAAQRDRLPGGEALPRLRRVRPHRRLRDDVEREPARTLAAPRAGGRPRGEPRRLEALPGQPARRTLGSAEVRRVPPVLAVLVRHSRTVDVPPDRHRPLVHGPGPPAQRERLRRDLPVAGRPHQLRHDDRGLRLRTAGRTRARASRSSTARASATPPAARGRSTTRTAAS